MLPVTSNSDSNYYINEFCLSFFQYEYMHSFYWNRFCLLTEKEIEMFS